MLVLVGRAGLFVGSLLLGQLLLGGGDLGLAGGARLGKLGLAGGELLLLLGEKVGALRFVQEDRAFFTALIGPGGDAQFAERFKNMLGERLLAEIQRSDTLTIDTHGIPADYAREIALGGVMAVVLLWLKKGAEEPCEDVAVMIGKAKRLSPYDLLG